MVRSYNLKFIKNEYASSLVTSEYLRKTEQVGLLESEKKVFFKYIKKTDKILDVGCGVGRVTFGLYDEGYEKIEGCDIAPAMIKEAKKIVKKTKTNIKFYIKNICSFSLRKNVYDVVIFSFNGLMCIPKSRNREKAIKNISKMLKKGGLFIFTAHDRNMGNFVEYFKEEKIRWDEKTQNKRLIEFGDIEYPDNFVSFLHIPDHREIEGLLNLGDFELIESKEKDAITSEENLKKEKMGNYMYYVARKL